METKTFCRHNGHPDTCPACNRPDVSESELTGLLPCPFCGGKPKAYWDTEDETEGYNLICCNGLHISTVFKSEALEAWNTRAR